MPREMSLWRSCKCFREFVELYFLRIPEYYEIFVEYHNFYNYILVECSV